MSTINLPALDTVTARLGQAQAVLLAVENAGEDSDYFTLAHEQVMAALWAARELVQQAQDAARRVHDHSSLIASSGL